MLTRWISAIVAIPIFLGLAFWGAAPFAAAVFILALLALDEMLTGYDAAGVKPSLLVAVMCPVLCAWAWTSLQGLTDERYLVAAAVVWLLLGIGWEVAAAARTGQLQPAKSLAYGLLCGAYVSLFSGMAWIRTVEVRVGDHSPLATQAAPLLLTVFCVWAADSFAYFVGRAMGKRKLAPAISPGKTVEGAIGGLLFAVLFGALFGWLFFRNVWLGVTIGTVAGVFGQIGDLFESALKRELGIKDFGGIMPGHGGVLDRFDSLLFVAPLAALVFQFWN